MTGAKIIMRNVKSRGMVLAIGLTITLIFVHPLPGIGNNQKCMPQGGCHAIRFYEDHRANKSGDVNLYPKFTGVYKPVGGEATY